jgi:hypothetical protein
MLSLQRKPRQKVQIGANTLKILEVFDDYILVEYLEDIITLRKGYMYRLEPDTIICYNKRKSTEARFQITSPRNVSRHD